jgi:hypothetical protein
MNPVLFPTQIALIDKAPDGGDPSAIERKQLDTHLNCHILQGKVSTDKPNIKGILFFYILFK